MYHDLENEFLDLLEADQNDPQVAYALGLCYLRGEGTEQDGAKAEQWLRRAAEQGHPEAQALLSSCRSAAPQREAVTEETLPDWCAAAEDGDPEAQYQVAQYFQQSQLPGTEDDVARYLSMAVAQGHPRACLMLGLQLLPEHPEEALRHLRNAADCGLAEAMEQLGECYAQGLGVAPDPVQAEHWFCAKAQQGDGEAMLALARRYKLGNGVPRSLGRALSWLKRAQLAGVTDAQDRYYAEERAKQAEEEAAKRAREEEERAQEEARAAQLRAQQEAEEARIRAQQEAEEAQARAQQEARARFQELLEKAQAGDPRAQFKVGVCYDDGDGCPQSAEEAFAWYKKAAQQGDLSAQFNLSWCY